MMQYISLGETFTAFNQHCLSWRNVQLFMIKINIVFCDVFHRYGFVLMPYGSVCFYFHLELWHLACFLHAFAYFSLLKVMLSNMVFWWNEKSNIVQRKKVTWVREMIISWRRVVSNVFYPNKSIKQKGWNIIKSKVTQLELHSFFSSISKTLLSFSS